MKRTLNIMGWSVLVVAVIMSAVAAAILFNKPQSQVSPNALKTIDSGETLYYGLISADGSNSQTFEVLSTAGRPNQLNLNLNTGEFFLQIWQESGHGTAEIWAVTEYNEYVISFTNEPCFITADNIYFTIAWYNSKILLYKGKIAINPCSGIRG